MVVHRWKRPTPRGLRRDTLSRLLASRLRGREHRDWRLLLLLEQRAPWVGRSDLSIALPRSSKSRPEFTKANALRDRSENRTPEAG